MERKDNRGENAAKSRRRDVIRAKETLEEEPFRFKTFEFNYLDEADFLAVGKFGRLLVKVVRDEAVSTTDKKIFRHPLLEFWDDLEAIIMLKKPGSKKFIRIENS